MVAFVLVLGVDVRVSSFLSLACCCSLTANITLLRAASYAALKKLHLCAKLSHSNSLTKESTHILMLVCQIVGLKAVGALRSGMFNFYMPPVFGLNRYTITVNTVLYATL